MASQARRQASGVNGMAAMVGDDGTSAELSVEEQLDRAKIQLALKTEMIRRLETELEAKARKLEPRREQ
jgi:hypothetical protein